MKTIKRISVLIGIFILIKVVFFIGNGVTRMQNASEAERKSPDQHTIQTQRENDSPTADKKGTVLPVSKESSAADDVPKPGYHRYIVGNGISVELPESWWLLPHDQIMGIKKKAGTDNDAPSNTTVAANSSPYADLNEGIFRASIAGGSFTAEELKTASRVDLDELCKDLSDNLVSSLSKNGMALTRSAYCSITTITNRAALSIGYQRTGLNSNGFWDVFVYHVPVNGKDAIFTTSYKTNASPQVQLQMVDVINSIRWN